MQTQQIPHDVLSIIFAHIPIFEWMPLLQTCKSWHSCAQHALPRCITLPHCPSTTAPFLLQRYCNWTHSGSIKCLYFALCHYLSHSAPRTFAQYLQHHPIWQHYVQEGISATIPRQVFLDSKLNLVQQSASSMWQMHAWPIRWRIKIIYTWTSKARNALQNKHVMIGVLPFRGYYGSGSMVLLLTLSKQAMQDVAVPEQCQFVDETEQVLLQEAATYQFISNQQSTATTTLMNNFFLIDGCASFIEHAICRPSSFLDRTPFLHVQVHRMHLVEQLECKRLHTSIQKQAPFVAEYWNHCLFTKPVAELDFLQNFKGKRFQLRCFTSYSNQVLYLQWEHAQKRIMCHVWHASRKHLLNAQQVAELVPNNAYVQVIVMLTSPMTCFVEQIQVLHVQQSWARTLTYCAAFAGLARILSIP